MALEVVLIYQNKLELNLRPRTRKVNNNRCYDMGLMSQMNNNIDPKNRRDKDGPIKELHTAETKKYI